MPYNGDYINYFWYNDQSKMDATTITHQISLLIMAFLTKCYQFLQLVMCLDYNNNFT